MKKFLVPTDFSETSKNAARYAVELAQDDPETTIILYNTYYKLSPGSDGSLLTESDEDRKTVLNQALRNLEIELHEISTVRIEYVAEEGSSLVDSIERYVRYNGINFVIMGITGATKLEQVFIGSNALNMARQGICPVIIVPPNARFKKIQNVMLLSDFKNVKSTTPVAQIKQILDSFKSNLDIVNVDSEHYVQLTEDYKRERETGWKKHSRITILNFILSVCMISLMLRATSPQIKTSILSLQYQGNIHSFRGCIKQVIPKNLHITVIYL